MDQPLYWAGVITTFAGALALLVAGVRYVRARWRRVADFLDDWNGRPARPGHDAIAGVPERLQKLEAAARTVQLELRTNSGSSMKDVVAAIDVRTRADADLLAEHLTWHSNEGHVDPTARVLLARDTTDGGGR